MEKEAASRVLNQKITKNTWLWIVQYVTETTGAKNKRALFGVVSIGYAPPPFSQKTNRA
jgi:hypothetical protein